MSELSREQYIRHLATLLAIGHMIPTNVQVKESLEPIKDTDAALRAMITQQAQELSESERKLVGLCHAHGTALLEIHDLKKELEQAKGNYAIQKAAADDYEQQLAAMTRERDAIAKARFGDKYDGVVKVILHGLMTDGAHHKQHSLECVLGMLTKEEWIKKAHAEFQWEKGIPS